MYAVYSTKLRGIAVAHAITLVSGTVLKLKVISDKNAQTTET